MSDDLIRLSANKINYPDKNGVASNDDKSAEKQQENNVQPETKNVSANTTLDFLGNNPAVVATMANIHFVNSQKPDNDITNIMNRTIFSDDIATQVAAGLSTDEKIAAAYKNTPPESVARIEKSVQDLEARVAIAMPAVEEELGATASEANKRAIAAGMQLE